MSYPYDGMGVWEGKGFHCLSPMLEQHDGLCVGRKDGRVEGEKIYSFGSNTVVDT